MQSEQPKRKRKPRDTEAEPTTIDELLGDAPADDPADKELAELTEALAGLDKREALFIQSYMRHGNERQAARDAGYSQRSNNHPTARNRRLARALRACQALVRKRAAFGVTEAMKELDSLVTESRQKDQMMAAVRAVETKVRVAGLLVHETPPAAGFTLVIQGVNDQPPPRPLDAEFKKDTDDHG